MRIRGLQLRGSRQPEGEHQLDLESAFTSVETRDRTGASGLSSLLCSLLYPEDAIHWLALHAAGSDARAIASLAARGESYLLVIDGARERAHLGRWDPATRGYRPVSSDRAEVATHLSELCPVERSELRALHTLGVPDLPPLPDADTLPTDGALSREDDPEGACSRLEIQLERAHAARAQRDEQGARVAKLRRLADALGVAQRAADGARAEIDAHAALDEIADGLDQQISAFREAASLREAERHEIEQDRRGLLAERTRLRGASGRSVVPVVLGAALGISGAAVAAKVHLAGVAAAATGMLMLLVAWIRARRTRRRLGRVEAVLGALRLRDRSCEQRFEVETAPLRAVMAGLDLTEIDELRDAVEGRAAARKQLADFESIAAAARAAFGEAEAAELAGLEAELAEPDPAERVEALTRELGAARARLARPGDGSDAESREACEPWRPADPAELVALAARGSGLADSEVRSRLAASLPLYLRALSDGHYTHARHRPGEGWMLRGPGGEAESWAAVPPELRSAVSIAFQLALLERLGDDRRVPLIVGPDAASTPARARALARVLGRLSSVTQVIRIGLPDPAWAAHAERTLRI